MKRLCPPFCSVGVSSSRRRRVHRWDRVILESGRIQMSRRRVFCLEKPPCKCLRYPRRDGRRGCEKLQSCSVELYPFSQGSAWTTDTTRTEPLWARTWPTARKIWAVPLSLIAFYFCFTGDAAGFCNDTSVCSRRSALAAISRFHDVLFQTQ